jgi:hypothetical protein
MSSMREEWEPPGVLGDAHFPVPIPRLCPDRVLHDRLIMKRVVHRTPARSEKGHLHPPPQALTAWEDIAPLGRLGWKLTGWPL